jgi:ATP-dependent DNA helicase RecQ
LENFVYGDTPTREALRSLLGDLFGRERELVLNLNELSTAHDIRPLVLRTLLTYLELDGYLAEQTPVYSSYQFKSLAPSSEILDSLKGEPREFLASVFRRAVKKRIWLTIDLEATAQALKTTRERIVKAFDWCEQNGWLEVRASDLRHRYLVLRPPSSLDDLAQELDERAQRREAGEIARLEQVLSLATQPGCLAGRLSEHFGETLTGSLRDPGPSEVPGGPRGGCGRCSDCTGQRTEPVATPHLPEWSLPELPPELVDQPRLAARFLCGVSSPALSRGRWTRDPRFGSLGQVPFQEVFRRLQS